MAKKIEDILKYAEAEISGLKAISIVETEAGFSHGSLNLDERFDIEAASAYNAAVLQAKVRAKEAMGMKNETISIIIIELSNQTHVIRPIKDNRYLIYAAADKSSNLGIIRNVMIKIGSMVEETIK